MVKRTTREIGDPLLSAGGGGGGRMPRRPIADPDQSISRLSTQAAGQADKSIRAEPPKRINATRITRPAFSDPMTDRAASMLEQSVKDRGGYPTRNGKPMMTKMQERAEVRKAGVKFGKGGKVGNGRDYCK